MRSCGASLLLAVALGGCTHDWDALSAAADVGPAIDAVTDLAEDDRATHDDAPSDAVAEDRGALLDAEGLDAMDVPGPEDGGPAADVSDVPDVPGDLGRDVAVDLPTDRCTGSGRAVCDGVCVDTRTELRHCGGCGRECPVRVNATTACVSSACVSTCLPGFRALPGLDCATFGGATSSEETSSPCGANPMTGACTCSMGFTPGSSYAIRARTVDAPTSFFNAHLRLCELAPPVTAGDWGGSYLYRRSVLPLSSDCIAGNPYLGMCCGCPMGFSERQGLPVLVGTDNNPADLFLCSRPAAVGQARTFLGAYAVLLGGWVTGSLDGSSCLSPNVLTGRCECPAGARTLTVRSMGAGVSSSGSISTRSSTAPAMIYICMR